MPRFAALYSLLAPPDTEPPPYPFVPSDVAQLQRLCPGAAPIDAQTWDDLLLEPYAETLSGEVSISGRQVLHQRLVSGVADADIEARTAQLRTLMADPAALAALHTRLRPLRRADVEVATTLFDDVAPPVPPKWLAWSALLPVALVASILAVIWSPAAWLVTGVVLFFLMSLQRRYAQQVDAWKLRLDALRMVLATTALVGEDGRAECADMAADARTLYKRLGRSGMTQVPGAAGYADWFALANVRHYFRSAALVLAERAFLRRCFLACANLEADVALARHLLGRADWCWSERSLDTTLALAGAVHPLMQQASPLSLALAGKGAFLSGRNGVGKSTFLRTVGINLITSRAFGFCYAQSAVLPALPVHASMRSADSLLAGESLYLAELRRAKELLAASHGNMPGIFLVDEIFRGTNHLESVSAAAAVLDDLASRAPVLVSSHNLVLAPLLAHRLDPYFITRTADGALSLAPGVLAHTNGISLLADHGFGAGIEKNAARVCRWLGEREVGGVEGLGVLC
jgi:hypothetical protein